MENKKLRQSCKRLQLGKWKKNYNLKDEDVCDWGTVSRQTNNKITNMVLIIIQIIPCQNIKEEEKNRLKSCEVWKKLT